MSDYASHSHTFGQDRRRPGETRTLVVMAITAAMMVIEIAAGIAFGSMALLADGLHMGSHAVALGINVFAYVYARRNARNPRFSFGTGKVNSLGGFTGALLLAGFAAIMVYESVTRLVFPVDIAFGQAIAVAVVGLIVNGASLLILGDGAHGHSHSHSHGRGHGHGHGHAHEDAHGPEHDSGHSAARGHSHRERHGHRDPQGHGDTPATHATHDEHDHGHSHGDGEVHGDGHAHHAPAGHAAPHRAHAPTDHNLLSAYLHVLADTLTSVLAIAALLAARYLGWVWFDPVMGLVGAALVARWSWGLVSVTSAVLLDRSAPEDVLEAVRDLLESADCKVVDLHVWAIGPGQYAAVAALEADRADQPATYRERLRRLPQIVHASIEVNPRPRS